jgi:sphingomyelin phosphodiesterase
MTTVVYVHNNTPLSFAVGWKQDGTALSSKYWKKGSAAVNYGRRARVLSFNRDKGITNGKNFFFTTTLTRDGSALQLKQKLRGKFINSTMWQSLAGPGFSHGWHSDRVIRSATWSLPSVQLGVRYSAYFTGTDDDIEYVLHHRYSVAPSNDHTINVLAYNIYMRTGPFVNGQAQRTDRLPAEIRGYDVIVFSEAFHNGLRKKLIDALRSSYPHASRILGKDSGPRQDGGVIIVSRWPIVAQAQRTFGGACHGSDCLADKGVLYVKIMKGGRPYHIFGSHTQADHSAKDRSARKRQFEIIRDFIKSRRIPSDEAVIIAGDLNVERAKEAEFQSMLNILGAVHPTRTGLRYSHYSPINDLASGPPELLDYVLWSKNHLPAVAAFNEVRMPRARIGWKDLPTEKTRYDLSDHFPVYGRLTFRVLAKPKVVSKKAGGSPRKTSGDKR